MRFLIDSANMNHINDALKMGAAGVTANPSMYVKENVDFYAFIQDIRKSTDGIVTAEVMEGSMEKMLEDAEKIIEISKDIIIKVNFSKRGLEFIKELNKRGIKTAMTLIFSVSQAMLAVEAGADYIFFFIGRNENTGVDGLEVLNCICSIVKEKGYQTKVVAASIKNPYHVEESAKCGADYAAIPYDMLNKVCYNSLTEEGASDFTRDWEKLGI